jgi:DDE family transposase
MADDTTTQCWLFRDLNRKPVVIAFNDPLGSSDGGGVLLKAADGRLGITARLAGCLRDERDSGRIRHEMVELLTQRVMAIALGYADGNDAARLAQDPIHKMLVGRDPVTGEALASQPTLSRFENSVGRKDLYRMGEALADTVVERHRQRLHGRARRITIDLDPTDDPTHGAQQLALFNGHYDTWCYLPVVGFLSFDDEPNQYLFCAVLRPGNAPAKLGALGILRRILARLRGAFPKARFRVRLDGGFASEELFAFLDAERLDYVVAMGKNEVLKRRAKRLMGRARRLSRQSKKTAHVYGECRYAAKKWSRKRRMIIKAEVVRHPGRTPKDNPRFLVTNMTQTPRWIYETVYCHRGEIENRIKELHHGLEMDRTSCSRFWANQFRVILTAAAYVLMQEIRLRAARTSCARAQVSVFRERLFKIGARVVESVRRIVVHLPASFPYLDSWSRLARSFGAAAT